MNTEDDNYVRGWPLLLAATLEYETEIENRDRRPKGGGIGNTYNGSPPENNQLLFINRYQATLNTLHCTR